MDVVTSEWFAKNKTVRDAPVREVAGEMRRRNAYAEGTSERKDYREKERKGRWLEE